MDNLGDIRLFVEAAALGSLSAAGRKLDLSPAAASARLVRLEAALGVQLFERTTRTLRLTDEGRTYLVHCQLSDSLSHLLQDDIDLAIRFGVPADSTMIAKRMAPNRRVLCASPGYLAAHGTPADIASLAQHRFVLLSSAAGVANEWHFSCNGESATFTAPPGRSRETNDGAIAREWALEGHGIAMKSIWDIGADLQAGRLELLLPEWRCPDAPVHALFQRRQFMAPRVRALLDFLAVRFAEGARQFESYLN